MTHLSRRSALGLAAAAVAAPLAATLPARATEAAGWSGGSDLWTPVSSGSPARSYWVIPPFDPEKPDPDIDARDSARTGRKYTAPGEPESVWRAFFRVPVAALAGWTIDQAVFSIVLTHSVSGTPTPVSLFHVRDLDPAVEATWNTTSDGSTWRSQLGTVSGSSFGSQPDQRLDFQSSQLVGVFQAAATQQAPYLWFGLRNPDESNKTHWKKFDPTSVRVAVFGH